VTASGDIDRVGLALTVDGLDKTYADGTRALDGLTLHISLSTRGHGRARPERLMGRLCRRNVIASARTCTPVPPDGEEGVDVTGVRARDAARYDNPEPASLRRRG
jgi:hypothetical protein